MNSLLESRFADALDQAVISSPNDRQVGGDHYAAPFQHWDFVPRLGLCWQEGCGTKYLARIFKKHAADPRKVIEDMEKVIHYVEKQIELVAEGVVFPHPNFPAYAEYHQAVYREWTGQQDFGTNDVELVQEVRNVLLTYSNWSWNVDGPVAGLRMVIERMNGLIALYKSTLPSESKPSRARGDYGTPPLLEILDDFGVMEDPAPEMPVTEEEVGLVPAKPASSIREAYGLPPLDGSLFEDPVKEDPSVVEQQAYIAQAADPVVPSPQPEVAPQTSLDDALIQQSRLSLQMLIQNQPLSTPVEVYLDLLENVRRFEDVYPMNLEPRITAAGEDRECYSSFRDYAEPLNKISLGVRTLDESLPNKQLTRTAIALWAVLDGVTNLQHWMLRLTEGDNPVLKDEEAARYTRLQVRKCTAVLHQNALAYMSSKGIDPGIYTLGTSLMQPANGTQGE